MFWKTIKENIEYLNLTQTQISLLTGITERHLSEILNGKEEITPESSASLGKLFGLDPLVLFDMQTKYNKLNSKPSDAEEAIINYTSSLDQYKLTDKLSMRLISDSFFPGKDLNSYKNYLSKSVVGFKKYKDKPLAYLWIALMEHKFGQLKSSGLFKKSSKETVYKNVIQILLSNKPFDIRLEEVKEYLSKSGIILAEGPFIKDSTIHGVSIERGHQKFIFISDMDKREYTFIVSLIHELVHYYENINQDDERAIDNKAYEILSRYMSKYDLEHKDLSVFFEAINSDLKEKDLFDHLHANTKKKINFGNVEKVLIDNR